MERQTDEAYLNRCIALSLMAREAGNTPFGAILVDESGKILLEQGNEEVTKKRCTGHAETALMERASHLYDKDFLWTCSLYSSAEPCCMCAGAIYWGNVGRVVYAMSEKTLLDMTGNDAGNPSFDLPCREVFARGQKPVVVEGPFPNLEAEAAGAHLGFWQKG